jgi:biotin operon repressor
MATDVDLDPVSEVVNADWQFDVIRTYILGVEILDARLTDAEFRLLALLRLRASGSRNNFVSHETLAKDLNSSESSIKRAMNGLKKKGYVTCQSRGFAKAPKKTITSMVERYAPDILTMSRKQILGNERTDDILRRLHGTDKAPDNPSGSNLTPHGIIEESGSHTGQICTPMEVKNDPPEGSKMTSEVNQDKLIQVQDDSTRSARGLPTESASQGSQKIQNEDPKNQELDQTTVVLHTQIKPRENSADDDREELARKIQAGAWQRAVERTTIQRKKRFERLDQRDISGQTDARKEEKAELKKIAATAPPERPYQFMNWAREEYDKFFPDVKLGAWNEKDFKALKSLLDSYDDDYALLQRAWTYVVEKWGELSKKIKRDGAPTFDILSVYRNSIFPVVQSTKSSSKPRQL